MYVTYAYKPKTILNTTKLLIIQKYFLFQFKAKGLR